MTTVEVSGGAGDAGDVGAGAAAEAVEAAAEAVEAAAEAVEATAEAAADVAEEASETPAAEAASGDVELHERVTRLEMGLQAHIDDYDIHQSRQSVEFTAEMAAQEAVVDVVEAVVDAAEATEETAEGTAEEITVVEPDVAASTERKGGGLMGALRRIY